MKVVIGTPKTIEITGMSISLKVSDNFSAEWIDDKGYPVAEYNGYVPSFFPGEHYGDYVELEIDLETGVIKNWKKPTPEDISQLIEKKIR